MTSPTDHALAAAHKVRDDSEPQTLVPALLPLHGALVDELSTMPTTAGTDSPACAANLARGERIHALATAQLAVLSTLGSQEFPAPESDRVLVDEARQLCAGGDLDTINANLLTGRDLIIGNQLLIREVMATDSIYTSDSQYRKASGVALLYPDGNAPAAGDPRQHRATTRDHYGEAATFAATVLQFAQINQDLLEAIATASANHR